MDQPENNLQGTSGAENLRERCEDLQRQVNLLFGALVVASFTLTLYLGLQAKRAAAELRVIKPREEQLLKSMDQDTASAEGIYAKLSDFAKGHPDFQNRIFYKYKVGTNSNSSAQPPKK